MQLAFVSLRKLIDSFSYKILLLPRDKENY